LIGKLRILLLEIVKSKQWSFCLKCQHFSKDILDYIFKAKCYQSLTLSYIKIQCWKIKNKVKSWIKTLLRFGINIMNWQERMFNLRNPKLKCKMTKMKMMIQMWDMPTLYSDQWMERIWFKKHIKDTDLVRDAVSCRTYAIVAAVKNQELIWWRNTFSNNTQISLIHAIPTTLNGRIWLMVVKADSSEHASIGVLPYYWYLLLWPVSFYWKIRLKN